MEWSLGHDVYNIILLLHKVKMMAAQLLYSFNICYVSYILLTHFDIIIMIKWLSESGFIIVLSFISNTDE